MIDIDELTPEAVDDVANSGIQFMRSITDAFGTDIGLELWDKINTVLGPDVKAEIFFRLLKGDNTSTSIITPASYNGHEKVSFIKLIRAYSGLGLKDAKDIADAVMDNNTIANKSFRVPWEKKRQCIMELAAMGVQF